MIKYDDFALPSLENIENMARAYSEMEKRYLSNDELKNEDAKIVQEIYDNLFSSYDIVSKLCEIYPKNRKFLIIGNMLTKLKVNFESDFINFELDLPNNKYTFSESTIIYDLIKIWAKCIMLFTNEVKHVNTSKKYITELITLINEIIKY